MSGREDPEEVVEHVRWEPRLREEVVGREGPPVDAKDEEPCRLPGKWWRVRLGHGRTVLARDDGWATFIELPSWSTQSPNLGVNRPVSWRRWLLGLKSLKMLSLELCRRHEAAGRVQARVVVAVDPFEGREFDVCEGFQGPSRRIFSVLNGPIVVSARALMFLCQERQVSGVVEVGDEQREQAACEVAHEAAAGFAAGLAFGGAALDVGLRFGVVLHADHRDRVERVVGLAIAAAVEAMAAGLAAGRFDGRRAAERGQRAVIAQPIGVVAGEAEQLGGRLRANAVLCDQAAAPRARSPR